MTEHPARAVFLHIGLPKSGTTFLQELLAANRGRLRRAGLTYPLPYREAMFHAAIDLRGTREKWGLGAQQVDGMWDRLSGQARAQPGNVLISHENLSGASPEQVRRATDSFPGFELHVVVTVRELGRQLTAGWQEGVKSGSGRSFTEFSARILEDLDAGTRHHRFWRMQDLPAVLEPWTAGIPPERVHIVTCPPPGADRLELWRRFADAVGIDPALELGDLAVRANESLGVAAVALLRDVNVALKGDIDRATYRHVVKRYLAQRVLPAHESRRASYPPGRLHDHVVALSQEWVAHVREAGYQVHGDLDDLLAAPVPDGQPGPDEVTDAEKYDVARLAVVELVQEVARLRDRRQSGLAHRVASELREGRWRTRLRRR